jgi:hypothetical protein
MVKGSRQWAVGSGGKGRGQKAKAATRKTASSFKPQAVSNTPRRGKASSESIAIFLLLNPFINPINYINSINLLLYTPFFPLTGQLVN